MIRILLRSPVLQYSTERTRRKRNENGRRPLHFGSGVRGCGGVDLNHRFLGYEFSHLNDSVTFQRRGVAGNDESRVKDSKASLLDYSWTMVSVTKSIEHLTVPI